MFARPFTKGAKSDLKDEKARTLADAKRKLAEQGPIDIMISLESSVHALRLGQRKAFVNAKIAKMASEDLRPDKSGHIPTFICFGTCTRHRVAVCARRHGDTASGHAPDPYSTESFLESVP